MEDLIYSDNYECIHLDLYKGKCPDCGYDRKNFQDKTEELNFDS